MKKLVEELAKHAILKEDISILIQESVGPFQASVNTIRETMAA